MPRDERTRATLEPVTTPSDEVLLLLEEGRLEILGLLPRSSNYTFLAKITGGSGEILAVYKPRTGETPLWDFPQGTLCQREVAAYLVALALGWPWVPATVIRDGPQGPGSVQLFVEFDPRAHYFTMGQERPAEFRRIALFDAAVNNADRKSGHCLLSSDGRVFVIDHGVCFHEAPKLRSVIWDFAGDEIAPELLQDLEGLAGELGAGPLRDRLLELLSAREVAATEARVARLLATGRFPEPAAGRPYPWPPV